MDKREQYRNIIEEALTRHANALKDCSALRDKAVFDRQSDNYLIIREGWQGPQRIHTVVTHLEIINGKIWIQVDWIEHGIAADLEDAGIPKNNIVLGFYPPDVRPDTEYAMA